MQFGKKKKYTTVDSKNIFFSSNFTYIFDLELKSTENISTETEWKENGASVDWH